VYNTVHMMMPMNLQRIKMAAARLKPKEVQEIHKRQVALVAASKAAAAAAVGSNTAAAAAEKVTDQLQGVSLAQQPQAVTA
jgi:ribosomal protein L12E/L44/L45/RPP1/RPP2